MKKCNAFASFTTEERKIKIKVLDSTKAKGNEWLLEEEQSPRWPVP